MFKLLLVVLCMLIVNVNVTNAEVLGSIETSGMVFKDSLQIEAFDDPYLSGVTCYIALPKKSLSFSDQTDASISCRKTGKITGKLKSKKRIFKEKKGIFVKSLYVDRIYDVKRNVLIYVSYTSKLSGDNASNSVSVVVVK